MTQDYTPVRQAIEHLINNTKSHDDGSIGPLLIRLAWHSCGTYDKQTQTGGSNGARMRFEPERSDHANRGIEIAREALEPIKRNYEWITYADLYTLAGVVAVEVLSSRQCTPKWSPGRTDLQEKQLNSANMVLNGRLPDAAQGANHIRQVFYRMGFNDREIVALSGAHSLGRCHTDRSGYEGIWTYTPLRLTNQYYKLLKGVEWKKREWNGPFQYQSPDGELMMLPTDIALINDPKFHSIVIEYANDQNLFFQDFAKAFSKLMHLGMDDNVQLVKSSHL